MASARPTARAERGLPIIDCNTPLLPFQAYLPDGVHPNDAGAGMPFAYGHTGYTGTAIRVYPEQGVYILALTNRVHPDDSAKVEGLRREVWRTVGELLMGRK